MNVILVTHFRFSFLPAFLPEICGPGHSGRDGNSLTFSVGNWLWTLHTGVSYLDSPMPSRPQLHCRCSRILRSCSWHSPFAWPITVAIVFPFFWYSYRIPI